MPKMKGYNARLYIDGDLLAHSDDVVFNFDTDNEETTDAEAGDWAQVLPTINRWNIDTGVWYQSTEVGGNQYLPDLMTLYIGQEELALVMEIDPVAGLEFAGVGYLTNVNIAGGTGAGYMKYTAAFIGTGEIC